MGEWNSRGLRGSAFEELINLTNERYRELGLALIQKVPTPITPIEIDKHSRHITLAYFDKKVPWIISGPYRGFLSALMPKNVRRIPFPCRMFIRTRWHLWRNLRGSVGLRSC